MIRLKVIKPGKYPVGETIYVSRNEAHDLIDGGYALISKDMVSVDYQTKKPRKGAKKGYKWQR